MLRNIIEQCIEFQRPLLINFIDFKKAFDSIQRGSLWKMLRAYGIPQRFVNIFQNLYISSSCCVRTDDGYTDFFNIETGVKQGCILSPILFSLTVDYVMKKVMSPVTGIPWTNGSHLTDLDFADDIALLANTKPALQSMTTCHKGEAEKVGLRINTDKTKVMRVNRQTKGQITIGQQMVEDIDEFTYLGSIAPSHRKESETDLNTDTPLASQASMDQSDCPQDGSDIDVDVISDDDDDDDDDLKVSPRSESPRGKQLGEATEWSNDNRSCGFI
ncbi:hypothetical protein P4O66_003535 [Electrophorus voltai]|uniref:Reverse transcriptase domain-containing protein n=1 Tax=Electrophorus voltai TaxID=2609070 RepID=A0AAD8ZTU4_9TELE|nr:hypothetical protein P4O66_003535 [Electrophorus voltai]